MAIVISKNSALNDDLWKPVAQVLNAVLLDADAEKTEFDKLVSKVAIEKKSKKYAEKQSSVTAMTGRRVLLNLSYMRRLRRKLSSQEKCVTMLISTQ